MAQMSAAAQNNQQVRPPLPPRRRSPPPRPRPPRSAGHSRRPQPAASFALTPPQAPLAAGATFQVPVVLNGATDIASVPIQLQYDPAKLSLVNVAAGDLLNRDGQAVALIHRDDGAGQRHHRRRASARVPPASAARASSASSPSRPRPPETPRSP